MNEKNQIFSQPKFVFPNFVRWKFVPPPVLPAGVLFWPLLEFGIFFVFAELAASIFLWCVCRHFETVYHVKLCPYPAPERTFFRLISDQKKKNIPFHGKKEEVWCKVQGFFFRVQGSLIIVILFLSYNSIICYYIWCCFLCVDFFYFSFNLASIIFFNGVPFHMIPCCCPVDSNSFADRNFENTLTLSQFSMLSFFPKTSFSRRIPSCFEGKK